MPDVIRRRADLAFSLFVLAMMLWMVWEGRDWALKARLFPWTIGIPGVLFAALQVVFAIRNFRAAHAEIVPSHESRAAQPLSADEAVVAAAVETAFGAGSAVEAEEELPREVARRRLLEMSLWIFSMAVVVVLVGFRLAAALMTLAFLRFAAQERWRTAIVIAFITYLFFFLVFDWGLNVPFPNGLVADALGLPALDGYLTEPIKALLHGLSA